MKRLPNDVTQLVREFASDKIPPTPTALLLKDLRFDYMPEVHEPVYWPLRLSISIRDPATGIRFLSAEYGRRFRRRFMLHDFIPSYWSSYADTFDGEVYEDSELLRRLQHNE